MLNGVMTLWFIEVLVCVVFVAAGRVTGRCTVSAGRLAPERVWLPPDVAGAGLVVATFARVGRGFS